MQKRNVIVAGSALALAAMGMIKGFEGRSLSAYQDIGGKWTICDGVTKGVKRGDVATNAQCDNMLLSELFEHNKPLESLPIELPSNVHLAILDWVYNVGATNATGSTLWKYLQVGKITDACNQITRWKYAAGRNCSVDRQCAGVWKRRVIERDLCLGDITINDALGKLGQRLVAPDYAVAK